MSEIQMTPLQWDKLFEEIDDDEEVSGMLNKFGEDADKVLKDLDLPKMHDSGMWILKLNHSSSLND
jgi:hypothetical protein